MRLFDLLFNTGNETGKDKLKIGDKVRVKYRDQEGYIIDKNGDLYMVSLKSGEFIDSYEEDQLEKISDFL